MQSAVLLDLILCQLATLLQLLAGKDQSLLVGLDVLLVQYLGLHIVDGVLGLDLDRDDLARDHLDEDLHGLQIALPLLPVPILSLTVPDLLLPVPALLALSG